MRLEDFTYTREKQLLTRKSLILTWAGISVLNYTTQSWTLMTLSITYLLHAAILQSDFNKRTLTRRSELEHGIIEVLRWLIFTTLIVDLSKIPWTTFSICFLQLIAIIGPTCDKLQHLRAMASICIPLMLTALTMLDYYPKQGAAGLLSVLFLVLTLNQSSAQKKAIDMGPHNT